MGRTRWVGQDEQDKMGRARWVGQDGQDKIGFSHFLVIPFTIIESCEEGRQAYYTGRLQKLRNDENM